MSMSMKAVRLITRVIGRRGTLLSENINSLRVLEELGPAIAVKPATNCPNHCAQKAAESPHISVHLV